MTEMHCNLEESEIIMVRKRKAKALGITEEQVADRIQRQMEIACRLQKEFCYRVLKECKDLGFTDTEHAEIFASTGSKLLAEAAGLQASAIQHITPREAVDELLPSVYSGAESAKKLYDGLRRTQDE